MGHFVNCVKVLIILFNCFVKKNVLFTFPTQLKRNIIKIYLNILQCIPLVASYSNKDLIVLLFLIYLNFAMSFILSGSVKMEWNFRDNF